MPRGNSITDYKASSMCYFTSQKAFRSPSSLVENNLQLMRLVVIVYTRYDDKEMYLEKLDGEQLLF